MKTLYIDCSNGAAGNMLAAALWEITDNKEQFLKDVNSAGIPGVKVYALPDVKCGVVGTHFKVEIHGEEEHRGMPVVSSRDDMHNDMHNHGFSHNTTDNAENDCVHSDLSDITAIINSLNVSDKVKSDAINVYKLIADAESEVHGKTVVDVHFHEIGAMDAIADIVSVAMLMEKLNPECIIASPVHTGTGKIKCAHGILPVPAPATTLLLKGIPIYATEVQGELCTPTGAALLKYFVTKFGPMPVMNMESIGYGMGSKDFETANYLRAVLGTSDNEISLSYDTPRHSDTHTHHPVNHSPNQKKAVLNRLSRTIGHLESVKRMVENDRDASEVLTQLSAVQSSIGSTARVIIKEHFKHSIDHAAKEDDDASIEQLYGIIDKFLK